ncbi:hypothetical protein [Actinoplanes sp. ATCC 53533]|uniref:hypothetical protein n=1 Tax=Actinoplanes sp. ATCC 53533 TaxID=1288362 RepID=UPI0018F46842|nr:hypothetical protein [Actinoplanes sp. ATCC 53533]
MIGSYVLNFQVYLGLPIEVRRVTGGETGVAILFAVSGLLTVLGQVRLTGWVTARWTPAQAITRGLLVMAAAFVPLALAALGRTGRDRPDPRDRDRGPGPAGALGPPRAPATGHRAACCGGDPLTAQH